MTPLATSTLWTFARRAAHFGPTSFEHASWALQARHLVPPPGPLTGTAPFTGRWYWDPGGIRPLYWVKSHHGNDLRGLDGSAFEPTAMQCADGLVRTTQQAPNHSDSDLGCFFLGSKREGPRLTYLREGETKELLLKRLAILQRTAATGQRPHFTAR